MTPLRQIQQAKDEGRADGAAMLVQLRATQVSHDVDARSFARLPISGRRRPADPALCAGSDAAVSSHAGCAPSISVPDGSAIRRTFLAAQEIADGCRLSIEQLHGMYRPKHWREGEHWVRVHGVLMYRSPDVCELVGEIALHPTTAKLDTARRLMTWLVARGEPTVMPGRDEIVPPTMPAPEPRKHWWQQGQFA